MHTPDPAPRGVAAARAFVARLAMLGAPEWHAALERWAALDPDTWRIADRGLAVVLERYGAGEEGQPSPASALIARASGVAESFRWFTAGHARELGLAEDVGELLAAAATLAVLAREELTLAEYDVLTGPFRELLPIAPSIADDY